MLFNSTIFIFLFLPVTLFGWFGLHHFRLRGPAQLFLLAMSLWFYAYFHTEYLWIILASLFGNYLCSALMKRGNHKLWMWAGILFDLGLLFYFKYFDFFLENLHALLHSESFVPLGILLPLGISFFTFQQLSCLIDRGQGKAEHYPFLQYANFITFFPQLIAGPIVLHEELVPQLADPEKQRFDPFHFGKGIERFVLGLSKKVLLADPLSTVVQYGFDRVWYLDTVSAFVTMLAYAFQLYFDFSGYCDMALGIGEMFNLTLPENFNSPYKASSMQELWRRWHMTLTWFFTQYVYIPLGGSRRGAVWTYVNILIVFLLSGLWHGANWTFVLWGLLQGTAVCFGRFRRALERKGTKLPQLPHSLRVMLTVLYFALTLGIFRSDNLFLAQQLYLHLFTPAWTGFLLELASAFQPVEGYAAAQLLTLKAPELVPWFYAALFASWMLAALFILRGKNTAELSATHWQDEKRITAKPVLLGVLFFWCVISLSQAGEFLYFNF